MCLNGNKAGVTVGWRDGDQHDFFSITLSQDTSKFDNVTQILKNNPTDLLKT